MKCDEARPSCSRCQSTGRNCDGYSAVPVTREQISHLLRDGSSLVHLRNPAGLFDNDRESRCFDFFRSVCVPKSTTFGGSEFWLRRVLQMSHSEPAIKHATLALSSLHRNCELEHLPQPDHKPQSSLLYYSRAVSQTKSLLSQNTGNIEKLLVLCVLFICYENMAGNFPAAQMHLQNGLCILSESQKSSSEGQPISRQVMPDDILHTFSRIDFQAMIFNDSRAFYPFSTTPMSEPGPIPSTFSSIAQAQYHLFEHFKWRVVEEEVYHDAGIQPRPLSQSLLRSRLTTWETSFAALQLCQREGLPTAEMKHGLIITQIYYELLTVLSSTFLARMEISFDACYANFERMLTLIESLPVLLDSDPATIDKSVSPKSVSFEWGVIAPLFVIITRCRDPLLRRQALARLYSLHRLEGVWDSLGAARVAERVVEIEEEGLENIRTADDISNEKRVADTYVVVEVDQRMIFLTCTIKSDPEGPLETKSDVIYF